jgi:hypothetical protein
VIAATKESAKILARDTSELLPCIELNVMTDSVGLPDCHDRKHWLALVVPRIGPLAETRSDNSAIGQHVEVVLIQVSAGVGY